MKDIMTPKEYWHKCKDEHLVTVDGKSYHVNEWSIMKAYAQYYAKALIESMTDEDINDRWPMNEHFIYNNEGAKWLKNVLLKRLNQ